MPQRLAVVEEYLDKRLDVAAHSDRTGNGLLVRGRSNIGRIAAALNTSFETIAGAANAGADLLLVHHAPWAEIDLHLHECKLAAARDIGLSLYAAHEALDRAPDESVGGSLARQLDLLLEHAGNGDLAVGHAPNIPFHAWLQLIAKRLGAPVKAWQNNPTFRRVAVVPGGGGSTSYLAEASTLGCDTFLTGEGSLYTELFARETGLSLVYATHAATEFPSICEFATSVAAALELEVICIPEARWITGGGRAPIEYGWLERAI